ncbi:MAG: hypothetical protein DF280_00900 ['Brassica napus' phytoplasma]|nr:MAG: hypothetical protein DF280_00900 ['Brassica napus' phytoplasma]
MTTKNYRRREEIPSLIKTKFENIEEWYDDNKKCTMIKAKYTFDGIGYYQQKSDKKPISDLLN